uniref:Uncharacterized protein n=1 Tax=Anguilla anguilla TaxID=7936 RepID=A0A0E9WV11_ANGAN
MEECTPLTQCSECQIQTKRTDITGYISNNCTNCTLAFSTSHSDSELRAMFLAVY